MVGVFLLKPEIGEEIDMHLRKDRLQPASKLKLGRGVRLVAGIGVRVAGQYRGVMTSRISERRA